MQKRILVVLSGCGFLDGSEVHESVLTLLALSRAGAAVVCAAPDRPFDVVDHRTRRPTGEARNVLIEAARICRGAIVPLASVRAEAFDGIFLPGGFGAAKNLSTVAFEGAHATVDPDLVALLRAFRAAGKPIGAVCIAPAVVVAALREGEVTIGDDAGTAAVVAAMGGTNVALPVTGVHVDGPRKLVTAPAYMYDASIADVAVGVEAAVARFLELA